MTTTSPFAVKINFQSHNNLLQNINLQRAHIQVKLAMIRQTPGSMTQSHSRKWKIKSSMRYESTIICEIR